MHAPRQAAQPQLSRFRRLPAQGVPAPTELHPPAAAVGNAPTSSSRFCQVVGAHFLLKGHKVIESPASSVGRA